MQSSFQSRDATGSAASHRAALRAKLLSIVNSSADAVALASADASHCGANEANRCALLLDSGRQPLNLKGIVAAIRGRYPQVELIVLERTDDLRELPCEFGDGPHRVLATPRSSPVRTAKTRWHDPAMQQTPGSQGTK